MPELPEVEVTRLGLQGLCGEVATEAILRHHTLRAPIPDLPNILPGRRLNSINRRAKYLLLHFTAKSSDLKDGILLIHLGMSGSLRIMAKEHKDFAKHDHIDIVLENYILRYNDPRRFGLFDWLDNEALGKYPRLAKLGIEPLSEQFTSKYLRQLIKNKNINIKQFLMDGNQLVGVGNIYAAESLFLAKISPLRSAHSLNASECKKLVNAIKITLEKAITAGGSTLKNFVHVDGSFGDFQNDNAVYARAGQACQICQVPILQIKQGGRSTFYCQQCQN